MDDMTSEMLEVDGEVLSDADYGIFISNSRSDSELKQTLKQLGSMMVQSEKASISTLIDIYTSPSMSSMRRKIETAEQEAMQREQDNAKQQQETIQKANEAQAALEEAKLALEERMNIRDNETKLAIAGMNDGEADDGNDGVELLKLQMQQDKMDADAEDKKKKAEIESKKLNEQIRSNKAKEAIARSKPKPTTAK